MQYKDEVSGRRRSFQYIHMVQGMVGMTWCNLLGGVAVQSEADAPAIKNKSNISCSLLTQLILFSVWIGRHCLLAAVVNSHTVLTTNRAWSPGQINFFFFFCGVLSLYTFPVSPIAQVWGKQATDFEGVMGAFSK